MTEIVDIEALVATYLRDQGFRARATSPDEAHRVEPWVEVELLNAPSDDQIPVDYFIGYLVQFGCYAGASGGQPEANHLAYAVRAALDLLPKVSFDDAVVTSVKFLTMPRVPDTAMEPARERYMLDVRIHAHPKLNLNGGSS